MLIRGQADRRLEGKKSTFVIYYIRSRRIRGEATGETAGQPANDISDDIVVEQVESTFDQANLLITSAVKRRFHDATGKGALGMATGAQPRCRVTWVENGFDAIGRNRFESNYGTNGGTAPIRPDSPAAPSDLILVNVTRYNDAGYQSETIATDGVIDRSEFDDLGQVSTPSKPVAPKTSAPNKFAGIPPARWNT